MRNRSGESSASGVSILSLPLGFYEMKISYRNARMYIVLVYDKIKYALTLIDTELLCTWLINSKHQAVVINADNYYTFILPNQFFFFFFFFLEAEWFIFLWLKKKFLLHIPTDMLVRRQKSFNRCQRTCSILIVIFLFF